MKSYFPIVALLSLSAFSCDKAKNWANQTRVAVEGGLVKKAGEADTTTADPALQKLVDQTPEGVIFRKDLPFPRQLEVKTTRLQELAGRFVETSAIESQVRNLKGTETTVTQLERAGDQVRYTLEQSIFTEPVKVNADKEAKPEVRELAPPSKPCTYKKSGSTWKADNSQGFRAVALSKQLSPMFEQLLIENALAPRPLWFAKRRLQIGDQITVAATTLAMLMSGDAKGSFTLTLKSFEAVKGHPCGVFAVSGDFKYKQFPDFEGNFSDKEVTIQSGKLWLSLIYPLVLKEETDCIQTLRTGGQGGLTIRGQGSAKITVIREWKKTGP